MANPKPNRNPMVSPWPEKDELSLLNGVLEMAAEPAEEHNPRIDMFHRISRHLNRSLPNLEVLGKVEELRQRYEKKWRQIHFNKIDVKITPVFLMSETIWGGGIEKRMKKAMKKKRKEEAQRIAQAKAAKVKSAAKRKQDDNTAPKRKKQKAEGTCFVCGKHGHFVRSCRKQKKEPIKQQGTKEISEGTVELQVETENKREEMLNELVVSSIEPGFNEIAPEETPHKHQVPSNKKAEDTNIAKSGAHQHTSDTRRVPAQSNFQPIAYQKNLDNRFRPNVYQQNLRHDNSRSLTPPILPHPHNWSLRPLHVVSPMYARPPPHMPYPFLPPRTPMFYPRPPPDLMNRTFPPNYRHFNQ